MSAVAGQEAAGPRPVRARLAPTPRGRPAPATSLGPAHRAAPTLRERIEVLRAVDTVLSHDEETPVPPTVDPARLALSLAGALVEVVRGTRPTSQLARWLAPGVLAELRERTALTACGGHHVVLVRPSAVRRLMANASGSAVEVSAAVDDGIRVRAVAFRLEAHRGGWRVTALEIG
ncbi:MAG: energy transducer TonB [Actinobacteria bacterium]|nr:energy transducer TonB [Actinomycetota bacterium]MCG2803231.1 Rv3235 family protein [Cellulomonas sp.]